MRDLSVYEYKNLLNIFNIRYRNSRKNRLLIELLIEGKKKVSDICNLQWEEINNLNISKELIERLFVYKLESPKSNYVFATNKGLKPSRITIYEMINNYSKKAGIDNIFKSNTPIKEGENMTMTITQIAEVAGCSRKTVDRLVRTMFPDLKTRSGVAIKLDKDQSNNVMSKLPKKNYVEPTPNVIGGSFDMKMFSEMLAISLATALKPLYDRLDVVENKQPKQLALPSTPDIEPRPYLNQLVREYATLKNVPFQVAWNTLYEQMLYRCKMNVKVRAKNEGIKPIDYLDRENLLLTACSIMKSLING